ncbi:hypothetical protein ACIG0C_17780 [Kitasatospora aureofaciens]|uniref:Uncharacterized protein n=1 Tax=Kitasatospora aureofaciens TaxID=1894 RepID=A0A1E7N965_KITAU|nr:hypothetical protein [Kitasatospora aureofaciens]OEV37240.1 hypothetical protein HS99_0005410 [Kitasatospora aureofaciens]UKZ03152.1 hypothetical protein BOQ63_003320 [Streptomyces viridifaciens]GGU95982.1 hypothetical protein GCM10010502_57430 [Kitasatospora aureofaciens]
MTVKPYDPSPTAEQQPHLSGVPGHLSGSAHGEPVGEVPTEHFAVPAYVAEHFAAPVRSAEHRREADDADLPTAELPAVVSLGEPPTDPTGPEAVPPPPPVFVDASGRRQRRIRRLGAVLAVPAGGYLALLASALLGGPTVNAPFLPLPQPPAPSAPAPEATPTEAPSAAPEAAALPGAGRTEAPAHQGGTTQVVQHPRPTAAAARPATGTAPGAPTATTAPAPATTPATQPSTAPTPTPGHGRPTTAPGKGPGKP